MLNLAESGRQIGEKLFALLTVDQKKELTQYVLENETGSLNLADNLYLPIFRGKYSIRFHVLFSAKSTKNSPTDASPALGVLTLETGA